MGHIATIFSLRMSRSEAGSGSAHVGPTVDPLDPPFVGLFGRRTSLTPCMQGDLDWIYQLAVHADVGYRWRLRGETPPPDAFARFLWSESFCQFAIRESRSGRPLGLVQAYAGDHVSRHTKVAVLLDPSAQLSGWPMEAIVVFLAYLYTTWPFAKVYFEGAATSLDSFLQSRSDLFVEEGRLREHVFVRGHYDSWVIASMSRQRFAVAWTSYLAAAVGHADRPGPDGVRDSGGEVS